jgi:hypothetical protein
MFMVLLWIFYDVPDSVLKGELEGLCQIKAESGTIDGTSMLIPSELGCRQNRTISDLDSTFWLLRCGTILAKGEDQLC